MPNVGVQYKQLIDEKDHLKKKLSRMYMEFGNAEQEATVKVKLDSVYTRITEMKKMYPEVLI